MKRRHAMPIQFNLLQHAKRSKLAYNLLKQKIKNMIIA